MKKGKTVLITGATGLVGGNVLNACLESEEIGKVISLLRRPSGITHPKLNEVVISDFKDYGNVEKMFEDIDIAYYCLAVYASKVSREEYRTITVDYTEAFAKTLKLKSPEAVFCLFSAAGADSEEKSRMMWARVKGAAENAVLNEVFAETYIFRPGYIYPVLKRKEPSFAFNVTRALYPVLKVLFPKSVVTSVHLGRAICITGLKGGDRVVYENKNIVGIRN